MTIHQKQKNCLQHKLVMSQAMEHAFTVLMLPNLELSSWIDREIERNPLLVKTTTGAPTLAPIEETIASPTKDYTLDIHCLFSRKHIPIALHLLWSMDEGGVLSEPLATLAAECGVTVATIKAIRKKLQQVLPPGGAALSLRESLAEKLRAGGKEDSLAFRIINEWYDSLLNRDFATIQHHFAISYTQLIEALQSMRFAPIFEPAFTQESAAADIIIEEEEGDWHIDVGQSMRPHFTYEQRYLDALESNNLPSDDALFMRKHLASGKWLERIVTRREKMLLAAGREIIAKQRDPNYNCCITKLRKKLGCHRSTISRLFANKYVQTPHGVFTLRSFFNNVSEKQRAQQILQQLLHSEPRERPLSDKALQNHLHAIGFALARRTVAKYRSELGFPSAPQRKTEPTTPSRPHSHRY